MTVTGVNDSIADGDQSFYVRLDPSLSADTVYKGLSPQNVSLTNEDDDTAGVTVTPTSGLTTTEDGGTATFTVELDSQPEADVTIGLNSSDVAEGTVSPSTLTFTATNWNAPQTVTVTGVDDAGVIDGDQPYTVILNTAASSDSNYYGLDPDDVSVTNTDNDSAGFLIGSIIGDTFQKGVISGDTTEDGDAASFIVRLTSEPSDDVTVGVTTSDDTEGTVSPSQLIFTSLNWNAEQVVTATGKNDDLTDGNITYYVILSDATSTDSDYSGLTPSPDTVSVVNIDSNAPGFRIEPVSGLTTTEDGGTATFTVRLNGIPTADVTIGVSSSDTTEG
ncbi:MAG: calcium-binding protein, partial [bacterium]|nr:calcium-binding protein [bacterium]